MVVVPAFREIESLIRAGHELIPLHNWQRVRETDGKPLGKAPVHKGWTTEPPLSSEDARAWMNAGNNVGVRLRAIDFVVDIDPRNYQDADSKELLTARFAIQWDAYPCVVTPSGGFH